MRTDSTLDGRLALLLIRRNREGTTAVEVRNAENRERIMAIRWNQDTKNWTMENALDEHVLCHTAQADLARVHGLANFTKREEVQWLVASINNPAYNQTLLNIESEETFGARHDFDKACLLLRGHQRLLKSQKTRNVSSMGSRGGDDNGGRGGGNRGPNNRNNRGGRGRGGGGRGNDRKRPSQNANKRDNTRGGKSLDKATREDGEWNLKGIREGDFDDLARKQSHITKHHYPPEEFSQLEPLERRKLKLNQIKQVADGNYTPGQSRNPTSTPRGNDSKREISAMRKEMAKMSRMISEITRAASESDGSASYSEDDEPAAEVTNSNNTALILSLIHI